MSKSLVAVIVIVLLSVSQSVAFGHFGDETFTRPNGSIGSPEIPTLQTESDPGVCRPDQEDCEDIDLSGIVTPSAPDLFGPVGPPAVKAELTGDGIVRLVFVWSEECSHCHDVMENVLPPLVEKYGDQLEIAAIETSSSTSAYEVYLAAIDAYKVPPQRQGWPAIFIGDTHLLGSQEIRERLEALILDYLEQGGVAFPPIPGLAYITGGSTEALALEPGADDASAEPIYLAYFYQTGCQDCDRVSGDLDYLRSRFPQLIVEAYNVRDHAALCEWLCERADVPESHRLTAPTVFVGDDYVLEEDLDARSLEDLLVAYSPEGSGRVWENWEASAEDVAERSIVQRFRSLGVFTVVFAGLIDGLNPCAFATLIFFVSYLTLSGRKGKDVLSVGAAFTVGVFLAYMLVGVGFYRALDMLGDVLTTLGRWLYGLTAVFCLILAVVSFTDYLKARRGEIGDMTLNLPHRLRKRINATIRRTRNSRGFVAAAFLTGIIVSLLELACTGQVYLPTIIFVMSVPELKTRAALFLLLYNLLFVAPLVVVFVLAYYGTGAKQLTHFLQQRASAVKLGMSFLFLALGSWLVVSLI
jgi:cytochrome c biogenesis protein CcdA/thiol-disulfide isomerase/thioredoxin